MLSQSNTKDAAGSEAPAASNLQSMAKYRAKAASYNNKTSRTWGIRESTIDSLDLQPGHIVLDTGCGTGESFALLRARVGPSGRVIGVDQSPEMVELARRLVIRNGWDNVTVLLGFMETVQLPANPDAVLFHYTHDILQEPAALDNLFGHVRPGARVAVAGMKFFPWWTGPLNLYAFCKNFAWNGRAGGMWHPWKHLERRLDGWTRRSTQLGMGYIGSGRYRGG